MSISDEEIKTVFSELRKKTNLAIRDAGVELFPLGAEKLLDEVTADGNPFKIEVFESKDAGPLHRFSDARCPTNTHVGGVLHANFVQIGGDRYVAMQAPVGEAQRAALWAYLYEHGGAILDLTGDEDRDPSKGVAEYAPLVKGREIGFGPLHVRLADTTKAADNLVDVYALEVRNGDAGAVKHINRYHFSKWIDHGAVSVYELTSLTKWGVGLTLEEGVLMTHCRAGVGRTGTILTAISLYKAIENGSITKDSFQEHLELLIIEGRKQRGEMFLDELSQFTLLYRAGLAWLSAHSTKGGRARPTA